MYPANRGGLFVRFLFFFCGKQENSKEGKHFLQEQMLDTIAFAFVPVFRQSFDETNEGN